jgi:hypothetical protein
LFNPVFNCLTPIVIKRSETQADEGLTPADEVCGLVGRATMAYPSSAGGAFSYLSARCVKMLLGPVAKFGTRFGVGLPVGTEED